MKFFLPCILLLALLSCSNEKEAAELAFKKDICKRSINDNENLYKELLRLADTRGDGNYYRSSDSLVVVHTEEIISWRRNFIDNPNKENLLLYADSIDARHTRYRGVDIQTVNEIRRNKELLMKENDSTSFYNLLYFASVAENNVLRILRSMPGTGWPSFYIPSYLDKEVYNLQDTVFVTISMYGVNYEDVELDLSKVTCTIRDSDVNLKPLKIIKSGPNYIVPYRPNKIGKYDIRGEIKVKRVGNYDSESFIENEFKVASIGNAIEN